MKKIINDQGQIRMRIHGNIYENRILLKANPDYVKNLEAQDDPQKRAAWLEGSWDIAAGGYFEGVWDPKKHILKPFKIPNEWQYIVGFDWGGAKPASLGVWAVSDGNVLSDGRKFPRGSIIRVKEWYVAEQDGNGRTIPDKGLRLDNEKLAQGIFEYTKGLNVRQWLADPSIFKAQSGKTINEQLNDTVRLPFSPADNERVTGWQSMIRLMTEAKKDIPESPGLWIFDNCRDWIRTVPTLMRDQKNIEDIDSDSEDHIADETRYVCQSVREPVRIKPLLL
jgi:hypothetical protein